MWLAARAPTRIGKLVLCNTAPRIGTTESWNARIDTVRRLGMKGVAAAIVERWFTPEFRARSPETVAWALRVLEGTSAEGYAAACAALREADERAGPVRHRRPHPGGGGKPRRGHAGGGRAAPGRRHRGRANTWSSTPRTCRTWKRPPGSPPS